MNIVIVQARLGSSRLAGKILLPLGRSSALAATLKRCARIPGIDAVVCAVPDDLSSEPIEDVARTCGALVFRGSERDVLDRHHQAARALGARVVMRVTSDCPVIDPALCGEVLAALQGTDAGYACNFLPPLWPHGLDCRAFYADDLARAARLAQAPFDREHVTPWLQRNLRSVSVDGPGGGIERHRWTLDYAEDYAFFRALWAVLGERAGEATTGDILAALGAHPEIVALNRACIDQARLDEPTDRADLRITSRIAAPGRTAAAA